MKKQHIHWITSLLQINWETKARNLGLWILENMLKFQRNKAPVNGLQKKMR
jgi:hypothetical protein